LKDETVWKVVQLDRGILQWTSPTGRVYTTEPDTQLPAPDTQLPVPEMQLPAPDQSAATPAATPADNEDDEVAPF
jgi:hypothetical protein